MKGKREVRELKNGTEMKAEEARGGGERRGGGEERGGERRRGGEKMQNVNPEQPGDKLPCVVVKRCETS